MDVLQSEHRGSIVFDPDSLRYQISYSHDQESLDLTTTPCREVSRHSPDVSKRVNARPCNSLNIVSTLSCNMSCDYCYCGELPLPRRGAKLSRALLGMVRRFIESHVGQNVDIVFIGGEPLADKRGLSELITLAETTADNVDVKLATTIYSNGLVLTEKVLHWINEHQIHLILSIDGTPAQHDRHRRTRSGAPSSPIILRNLTRYRTAYWHPTRSVRTVITDETDYLEALKYLRKLGFNDIGIQGAYDASGISVPGGAHALRETLHWYAEELIDGRIFSLLPYVDYFRKLAMPGKVLTSYFPCDAAIGMLSVDPDGRILPCHHFATPGALPGFLSAANVIDHRSQYYLDVDHRESCCECIARHLCGGECYHRAYTVTGDYFGVIPEVCKIRRQLVPTIIAEYDRIRRRAPESLFSLLRSQYTPV